MKSWKKWLGITAGLLFSGYFLLFAYKTFSTHNFEPLLHPELLTAIFLAAILNVLLIPLAGMAWSLLLDSMGSQWRPITLSVIIGFTQIAKYVPGNIAQHIGRTTVALVQGVPPTLFFSSVLAESILLLAASIFVGVTFLILSPTSLPMTDLSLTHLLTVSGSILVLMTVGLLLLLKYVPHLVQRFSNTAKSSSFSIPAPTTWAAIKAFLLYCFSYLLLGISLWIIALGHGGFVNANLFLLTACFALAWLIGYLAPGAPAGLGVREGALTLLLSNMAPSEHVLTVVIASRMATIIADAVCFAGSAYLMRSIAVKTEKIQ